MTGESVNLDVLLLVKQASYSTLNGIIFLWVSQKWLNSFEVVFMLVRTSPIVETSNLESLWNVNWFFHALYARTADLLVVSDGHQFYWEGT